jgi:DNA-binding response OmpR family regulator
MSRVLLVEDDQFLSSILRDHLRSNGFDIECAFDGDMAVRRAIENHFDAILLDILLPQKDGFEVLATLKSMSATKQIPVVIISNLSDPGSVDRMMKGGAVSYLVKAHVTPDIVKDELKKAITP